MKNGSHECRHVGMPYSDLDRPMRGASAVPDFSPACPPHAETCGLPVPAPAGYGTLPPLIRQEAPEPILVRLTGI